LEQWLKLNTIFSYNGMVTFKKAENIRETLRLVPLDRLVLETDAPYLAPVPFRGQPNASKHIPLIAQRIAEERGLPLEELARLTTANARRFFRIG
ncbi:MAG: TatD family hydrolase, partial [Victivallales bacterium]|nr:TatD family hydrolase [Victivallales bacterium]